jgi:hypothetical protein
MNKLMFQLAQFGYAMSGILIFSGAIIGSARSDVETTITQAVLGLSFFVFSFGFKTIEQKSAQMPPFAPSMLLVGSVVALVASVFSVIRRSGLA